METVLVKTKNCPMCGQSSEIAMDVGKYVRWQSGVHVQHAFPDMSADDRELLITGTHPACWEEMFPEEEEDE